MKSAGVASGGGMAGMREQHRALGAEALHQRACGDARLCADLPKRQLGRAATVHDPHQCREHVGVLNLPASWTHRA